MRIGEDSVLGPSHDSTTAVRPQTSRGHSSFRGANPSQQHHGFNPQQMKSLAAICETFVPSLPLEASSLPGRVQDVSGQLGTNECDIVDAFYRLSASEAKLSLQVAGRLRRTLKPRVVRIVGWFLWLLSTRFGTFLLCGTQTVSRHCPFFQSFPALSAELREKALLKWEWSSNPLFAKLFKLFKGYSLFTLYSMVDENGWNPCWNAIGYSGPVLSIKGGSIPIAHNAAIKPLEGKVLEAKEGLEESLVSALGKGGFTVVDDISHLRSLYQQKKAGKRREFGVKCDVVVVGSGSGGGVIAGVLADAGQKVLVLEKGRYYARENLNLLEGAAYAAMYEGEGIVSTDDGNVAILSGSTVGGGSVVNWAASLKTPEHVRREWAQDLGLSLFATRKYQQAMDSVCERLDVRAICEKESFQNQILTRGCKALGYDIGQIPRNVKGQHACGWCCFGCKNGEKQATSETWLVDAVSSGALIISNCHALRVLHQKNNAIGNRKKMKPSKAVGVAALLGDNAILYVEARATVVSCGSLSTPPLLLKSGLRNANIGKNLHLHPVIMGWGYFPEEQEPAGNCYEGPIMTAISKEAANWNSTGYGALLEVPIMHPGSFAALIPWTSGSDHKRRMRKYSRTAHFISLTRDKGSGRVTLDSDGESAKTTYAVSAHDVESLFDGLDKGLRALVAAGAEEIGTGYCDGETFRARDSSSPKALEAYLKRTREKGLGGLKFPVISAHQMGSCKMGEHKSTSVVDETGETWEVENLFVGDASVFPTASGVNPMITVQSIAYCTAHNLILKLGIHA